jgi:hypothetical protein
MWMPPAQVLVKDRSVVETADAETWVVAPAGLQAAIDAEVAKVASGEAPPQQGALSAELPDRPRSASEEKRASHAEGDGATAGPGSPAWAGPMRAWHAATRGASVASHTEALRTYSARTDWP